MQKITPILNYELEEHIKHQSVGRVDPYPIASFRKLVEIIAQLSFLNKSHLLFYRGQSQDFRNKAEVSTFYPTIYRDDNLQNTEVQTRFELLDDASRQLIETFRKYDIKGLSEINRKRYVQWSILQHYEICRTPLLDFTHSIRVACSFAQQHNSGKNGYVFVFGLPYITNRISYNSEEDIVNIRLLSICPPDALRPYFQEGYLAGTSDITSDYESKPELDFNNRLIAKFVIPNTDDFWGDGFNKILENMLFPREDLIYSICKSIKPTLRTSNMDIGEFIAEWVQFEQALMQKSRNQSERLNTIRESINILFKSELINEKQYFEIQKLREFRNILVHRPKEVNNAEIKNKLLILKVIRDQTKL